MRRVALAAVSLCLVAAFATAEEAPRCAPLLTTAEVQAAVGSAMEDMGPETRGEGESLCAWMSRGAGGFKTIALTLWEPSGMGGESAEVFFEQSVKGSEESGASPRVAIAGTGGRSALLTWGEQVVAWVEVPAGVAHIVTNGLTKEQVESLAKAVARE